MDIEDKSKTPSLSSGFSNKNMPRPRSKHLRWNSDLMFSLYQDALLPYGLSSKDILGMAAYTRSKDKHEKESQTHADKMVADDIHSGATTTNITIHSSLKAKHSCDYSVPLRYHESYALLPVPISEGLQNPFMICTVANMANYLSTAGSLAAGPQINYSSVNMFALNPDSGITGSTGIFTSGTGYAPKKQYLSFVEVNITVSSMSMNQAYVDLYCVEAKQHIPKDANATNVGNYNDKSAVAIWAGSLSNANFGVSNQTAATIGTEINNQPGCIPNTRGFKAMYKIKSVHHLTLAGGAEETVNYHCPLNMSVDGMKLQQENDYNTGTDGNIQNLTTSQVRIATMKHGLEWFGVVRGGLAKQPGGPASAVAYGIGELGVVVQRKHMLHPLKNREAGIVVNLAQNNIQTTGGATLTKESAVDGILVINNTVL